jgi:hypothetical protein
MKDVPEMSHEIDILIAMDLWSENKHKLVEKSEELIDFAAFTYIFEKYIKGASSEDIDRPDHKIGMPCTCGLPGTCDRAIVDLFDDRIKTNRQAVYETLHRSARLFKQFKKKLQEIAEKLIFIIKDASCSCRVALINGPLLELEMFLKDFFKDTPVLPLESK